MSSIILVTSGKGGVGKTTVASLLGLSLAGKGKNVLILELDSALRGLDIMFPDKEPSVYSLGDVLTNSCKASEAINTVEVREGNLHYMLSPAERYFEYKVADLLKLLAGMADIYDFVLLDCAAGLGQCFDAANAVSDKKIAVATFDSVSIRDAALASSFMDGEKYLVINRFKKKQLGEDFNNLDEAVDATHMQLLGVISYDRELLGASAVESDIITSECDDMASRLLGETVPLNIKRLSKY